MRSLGAEVCEEEYKCKSVVVEPCDFSVFIYLESFVDHR